MSITLDDTQKVQVQTHLDLIQKAYNKVQAQQFAATELEKDFQTFINGVISDNGGNPDDQYTYNLETGTLEVAPENASGNNTGDVSSVTFPENPEIGDTVEV